MKLEPIPVPIIPGDIVVMYEGADIPHVAIVGNVIDANGDGKITREEVVFVEAASGHDREYRVMNQESWWSYRKNQQTYRFELKRLQQ